ncbi:thioredoxin domain-containing protein [Spirosoma arcticum]
MNQDVTAALQTGDLAPNATLPDGSQLAELRGRPVILAFAPVEWNPAYAYQSEIFARLSQALGAQATFVDTAADDWHSLDCRSELARQFGVAGQRALVLLDEYSVLRWKIRVETGQDIRPGEVLAALESLKTPAVLPHALSFIRRCGVHLGK